MSDVGMGIDDVQAEPARFSRSLSLKAFQDLRSFLLVSSSLMMSMRVRLLEGGCFGVVELGGVEPGLC